MGLLLLLAVVSFAAPAEGKVCLIRRGGCTFQEKVWYAEQSGCSQAIVFNSVRSSNKYTGFLTQDGSSGVNEITNKVTIPSIFISNACTSKISSTLCEPVLFDGVRDDFRSGQGSAVADKIVELLDAGVTVEA